jgi:1-acyl-sn-glycerol-3-phosphate acyltransferase
MARIRAVWRAAWFCGLMAFWAVGLLLGKLLRRGKRWRTACLQGWARTTASVCGLKIEQIGEAPEPPYFLVFNHLSYVDILPLHACLKNPMVCARHDFAHWPLIGNIARWVGAIWVHRHDFTTMPDVTRQMRASMQDGFGVVMAPEATTTRGDKVYPFHSTLLAPAAEMAVPVHYCALRFETLPGDPPAANIVNWWEDMTFLEHAWRLMHCRGVRATITFGREPVIDANRKVLARRLQEAVTAIYRPM